jgi:hypothetical protein
MSVALYDRFGGATYRIMRDERWPESSRQAAIREGVDTGVGRALRWAA